MSSNVYVIPAAASAVVATGLAVMGQPMQTVALAAAAVFPAVYLLSQQGGAQIKASAKSGPDYLDELDAADSKKKQKKAKKAEEARKKEQEKLAQQKAQEAAAAAAKTKAAAAADSTDSDDEDKPLTKTQIKKAKKEAARKAEEERLKAEADAKRKAEEADKKKKKKNKAKKPAASPSESSVNTDDADAEEIFLAQAKADKDEAGWSVQKSDKPSSLKQSKTKSKPDSKEKSGPTIPVPTLEQYAEMFIPFKNHAQLIGPKGATLQTLMEATGARIDMPKKDSGSTKVQITGSADAVKKAEGAINSLISKGYSSFTHPGWVHDDILVDEKHIGAVIGKGGEYIKTIQAKTNTRINTPDKDEVGGKVIIVGKKEDVRAARLAIKELMADGYSPLTHEGFIKKEIQFPADKLHLLIGAKGQTIKSIQGNTKTKINIPERTTRTSNTAPLTVTVVGEPAGVTQAEKEILRLLIPPQIIQEDPEEEYVNGTWSESGPTEDELWD